MLLADPWHSQSPISNCPFCSLPPPPHPLLPALFWFAAKVLVLSSDDLGEISEGESSADVDSASVASRVQALREACGMAPTSHSLAADSLLHSLDSHTSSFSHHDSPPRHPYPGTQGTQGGPYGSVPGAEAAYASRQTDARSEADSGADLGALRTPFNSTTDATGSTYNGNGSRGSDSGGIGIDWGTDWNKEEDKGRGGGGDSGGDWAPEGQSQMPLLVEVRQEKSLQFFRPMYTLHRERANRKTYVRNREGAFSFCPVYQCGKVFCATSLSAIT